MMGAGSWSMWLVDSFIAFSALLLLVLILRRPVVRWFGPEAAYMLWALPALRWLMPPLALENMGLSSITTWFSETPPPTAITDMPASPIAAVDAGAAASSSAVHYVIELTTLLPALWLAGVVGLFAFLIRHHLKIMGQVKAHADPLGNIGKVTLYESGVPTSPLASGLFVRSIFIPQSIRHWPEEVQRMAVAHEMTHHRSLHLIHNSIALALLCLNWFNPLAWAAARAFIVDQEADCDARTIAKYQFDRADYATMLMEAAKVSRPAPWALAPHAHLIPRKALVARIRRISMNKNDRTLRFAGYGLAFAAGIAFLPLTASIAEADDKVQSKSTSISSNDEGTSAIRISNGGEQVYRRNVSYKGKSFAFWSDRDMSDADLRRHLDQSEKAAAAADVAARNADAAMQKADRARSEADAATRDAAAAADKAERQAAWAADEAARQGAREGEQEARRAAAEAAREAEREARRAGMEAQREAYRAAREAQVEAQKVGRADAIAAAKEARATAQAEAIRARAEAQANVARIRAEAARNAVASVDWDGVRASVDGATATATTSARTIRVDRSGADSRN